jgi:glycine dehydrogenase subunit 1
MSLLGKHGLQQVANLCYQKAHFAADQLSGMDGFTLVDEWTPFFHEFVVKCDEPVDQVLEHLLQHNILGGYDLGQDYPELKDHLLLAVTEKIKREDIEYLCAVLQEENHG